MTVSAVLHEDGTPGKRNFGRVLRHSVPLLAVIAAGTAVLWFISPYLGGGYLLASAAGLFVLTPRLGSLATTTTPRLAWVLRGVVTVIPLVVPGVLLAQKPVTTLVVLAAILPGGALYSWMGVDRVANPARWHRAAR